jgi:hypothetical protein
VNNDENDFGVDVEAMRMVDFDAEFSTRNEGDNYK